MSCVTRSGDNRTVTCLEAAELGFAFVKTCSKCDYYLQNRALNMKALSMPRSELSKMWQCTSLHRVGDLNSSEAFKTPYQEVPITSYNSYIVKDHSSGSSSKRVQLFESVTPTAITNSSGRIIIILSEVMEQVRLEHLGVFNELLLNGMKPIMKGMKPVMQGMKLSVN
jgi:hypothetical protein